MTTVKSVVVAGFFLAATRVRAADYTWLATPASGNWNTTDENWSGAGSVWVDGSANNAVFGASDTQNVTADAVTLGNLTFNDDGYVIGGGPLLMYGSPTVGAGATATLNAAVTNAGVWTKYGGGTLALNPGAGVSNVFYALKAYTGTVHVVGGTSVVTQVGSNPESGPAFWVSGGTLVMGGGLIKTTGGAFARVSEYGTLLITNGLCDLSGNSELLNAHNTPGNTTVSGSGVLDVQGLRITQNTNPSSTALNVVNVNTGGTIRLVSYAIDAISKKYGTVNFNGGTSVAKAEGAEFFNNGNSNWGGVVAYVLEGGAIFDNNGKNITIRQALQSGAANDGGLTKKGTGNLNLLGGNTYRGGTFLWAGSISITNDTNLGAVPDVPETNFTFVGTSTLRSSANHTLAVNRTIRIPHNVTATFDTQSYTQTVTGVIAGEGTTNALVKGGAGMLILDPGNAAGFTVRTLKPTAGTLYVRSGSNRVTVASSGVISMGFFVSGSTLLVGGGEIITTGGGYGNIQNGSLIITNGTVNLSSVNELLNAYSGSGNVTVSGGGVLDLKTLRISQTGGSPDLNVVNVNTGGVIRMDRFYIDAATMSKGRVNFNGGTVVAKSTRGDFMGIANTNWYSGIFFTVREGGAVIDSNGFSIDSKLPIYSGAANDGGLTKRGAGTFTLSNTNMYNGVTSVEAGTLTLGLNDALPATNTVRVSSNAVFNVNGKTQTLAGLGGGGTVTNLASLTVTDTLAPGDADAFGTLTLAAAPASIAGCTLSVNVAADGSCDRLHVQGDLDVSALSLSVENTGLLEKGQRYIVATCSGTLSGTFASDNVPLRWLIRYDVTNRQVYLIYNFGTLIGLQ
jgi:autotransporter-associated beta strand protein